MREEVREGVREVREGVRGGKGRCEGGSKGKCEGGGGRRG